LGHVGLVLGVEMSRLARSCRDWHQLLEICALFDTLIADADGVYDPASYNDRLLLGLKGTMSEAELHILKARMLEGKRAKARRGELGKPVPMGYVRRASGEVAFDPDEQAQTTIRLVFDLFERFRTGGKVMRYLVDYGIRMPVRVPGGPRKGELEWHRVNRVSLYNLLTNPIYAGAYVYGARSTDRRRQKPGRPSAGRRSFRIEDVDVFLPDRIPAYISWEQYQRNQAQLRSNKAALTGVARAGQALLSGLMICGRCGLRMMAQYNNNGALARYACIRMACDYAEPICQTLKAAPVDALVTRLVLQALEPAALETSVRAASDLAREREALERQWQHRVERARYEAERTRRQYDAVEPENRLVARTLERQWEQALAEQTRLEDSHERFQREQPKALSPAEIAAIRFLATDVPALWQSATQEERQTILRLLLERVLIEVIDGSEQVRVECHWHGGNQTAHQLTRPIARLDKLSTYKNLLARIGDLRRERLVLADIAAVLNREGWRPAKRRDTFNAQMVRRLIAKAGLAAPRQRRRKLEIPRQTDEWTVGELAGHLGMRESTLYNWVQQGRLRSRVVQVGAAHAKLVYAGAAEITALQVILATPMPWRRRPPRCSTSTPSTQES
jgi:hypothetical protein